MSKKPQTRAIAKRYPQFQTIFEQRVTRMQDEVKQMETMRSLYTTAHGVLEKLNLPNDIRLELNPRDVTVHIIPTQDNTLAEIKSWLAAFGQAMVDAGRRETPEGSESWFSGWYHTLACWYDHERQQDLYVWIDFSLDGIKDHAVVTERKEEIVPESVRYNTKYHLVPRKTAE